MVRQRVLLLKTYDICCFQHHLPHRLIFVKALPVRMMAHVQAWKIPMSANVMNDTLVWIVLKVLLSKK